MMFNINSTSFPAKTKSAFWLGLLIAAVLVVFRELAFEGKIPFFMDPVTAFYPYSHYLAESLRSGFLPLWNPYIFGGYPFIGDTQAAVMYPFNLILSLAVVPERVLGVKMALHFILAGVFTFLSLRRLKCSNPAAFLGAAAFTFSGALFPKIALPPIQQTAALIPFCFFSFLFLSEKPEIRRAVFCGLPIGLFFLSGYIQIIHFTVICLLIFLIFQNTGIRLIHKKVSRPSLFLSHILWAFAAIFSIITAFIIITGGGIFSVGGHDVSLTGTGNPASIAAFFAVLGWFFRGGRVKLCFKKFLRVLLLWAVAVLLGACIAAPQLLPGIEFAGLSTQETDRTVSGVGYFEIQSLLRNMFLPDVKDTADFLQQPFVGTLPLLLFIAALIRRKKQLKNIPGFAGFSAVFVFSVLTISGNFLTLLPLSFIPGFLLFHHAGRNIALIAFPLSVLGALSVNHLLSGVKKPYLKPALYGLIILLTSLQLFHYYSPALQCKDPEKYFELTPAASFLQERSDKWRAYGFDERKYSFGYDRKTGITDLLIPNTNMLLKIRDVQGYSPLQLSRYNRYLEILAGGETYFYPFQDTYHLALVYPFTHSQLVDVLGVRYLLSENHIDPPGFSLFKENNVKIYENTSALPRAGIFNQFVILPDSIETAEIIHRGEIDIADTVVLARGEWEDLVEPGNVTRIEKKGCGLGLYSFNGAVKKEAVIKESNPNSLKIRVSAGAGGGVLFTNEIMYPGWTARIDEKRVPIIRANYLFRAVFVPEGEHAVEMRFEPFTFRFGLILSAAAFLLLLLILITGKINSFREKG